MRRPIRRGRPALADPRDEEPIYTSFSSVSGEKKLPPAPKPNLNYDFVRRFAEIMLDWKSSDSSGVYISTSNPGLPMPLTFHGTETGRFRRPTAPIIEKPATVWIGHRPKITGVDFGSIESRILAHLSGSGAHTFAKPPPRGIPVYNIRKGHEPMYWWWKPSLAELQTLSLLEFSRSTATTAWWVPPPEET